VVAEEEAQWIVMEIMVSEAAAVEHIQVVK
jgi:hypothetical protein